MSSEEPKLIVELKVYECVLWYAWNTFPVLAIFNHMFMFDKPGKITLDVVPLVLERHWFDTPSLPVTMRLKCLQLSLFNESRNMSPRLAHWCRLLPVKLSTNISIDASRLVDPYRYLLQIIIRAPYTCNMIMNLKV